MYYTGLDPRDMTPVYTATNPHEKAMQRALMQYRNPKNYDLVKEALERAGRTDLIGFGPKCLIRPRNVSADASYRGGKRNAGHMGAGTDRTKTVRPAKKKTIRNVHKKKQGK